MFEKGQIVRNPKQVEWGLGEVIEMKGPRKARIRFKEVGFRLLDLAFVELELIPKECEIDLQYPPEWEDEWKRAGVLRLWREEFPELWDGSHGSIMPTDGKLSNFPNYALMYLLRKNEGMEPLTNFELAHHPAISSTADRRDRLHAIMREVIGGKEFDELRTALIAAGYTGIKGEPDLFCWPVQSQESENVPNGKWFFAEAKWKDKVLESQHDWFKVCRTTLPYADIRVYRLRPQKS